MINQLPDSINTFFGISNGDDTATLKNCFTENAIVRDEKHTHQGHEAIQEWFIEAKRKYDYTVEPLTTISEGKNLKVETKVTGNFPGSPVKLEHIFQLIDGKIDLLEIY